ncbi:MAG: hypothetical protein HQ562_05280, partial [Candidatus Marinimicrobia bacterium]|nr:hypothetical protein [Candidatus Neomarinimicrobiota bacterium]
MEKTYPDIVGQIPKLNSQLYHRVIDRIKAHDPNTPIKLIKSIHEIPFSMPKNIPATDRDKVFWEKVKHSLTLREKEQNHCYGDMRFVHVFVAVEGVVESYQFVIGGENECPFMCNMCYLQGTFKSSPVPTIFTNFHDDGLLIREIKLALLAMHMHVQAEGKGDYIGRKNQDTVHRIMGLLNEAIGSVNDTQSIHDIFTANKKAIDDQLTSSPIDKLQPIRDNIDKFNFQSLTDQFQFNCSELNDGLANDHLTDNSKFLMDIFENPVMVKDGGWLQIRTKSDNFDNLLQARSNSNLKVSLSILAPAFIERTANIDEKLEGAVKLQKLGYKLSINVDPIFLHGDTVKVYSKILDKIASNISTDPAIFDHLTLGMLRFGKNTRDIVEKRNPKLFGHYQKNMVKEDEKYRYDRDKRIKIYKGLIDHARKVMPGINIQLSTE